jgi:hypothetical protein
MNEAPRNPAAGTEAPRPPGEDRSIVDLFGQLTQQGAHLAGAQVSLMQAEVREAAQEVKAAVAAMAAAAVFGIAGLGVLLMGVAYYVGDALDDIALGTTVTGAATLVIALILYITGKNKVASTDVRPDRSIDTLADTPAAMSGDITHSGAR